MKKVFLVDFPGNMKSSLYGIVDILNYASKSWGDRLSLDHAKEIPGDLTRGDYCVFPALEDYQRLDYLAGYYCSAIQNLYKGGVILCSVCLSSFFLARSGIVKKGRLTTHWKAAGELQKLHKEIVVDPSAILVDQGQYISTGGLTSYNDLALYLVKREYSDKQAAELAQIFLINRSRQSQLSYISHPYREIQDPLLNKLRVLIQSDWSRSMDLSYMEGTLGIHRRTLNRKCQEVLGIPPATFIRHLKLDHSAQLIDEGQNVEEAAFQVGYKDTAAFCRAFRKYKGMSPGKWRNR